MIKILFVFLNTFIFILCFFTIKAQANEIILKNCYQVKLNTRGYIAYLLTQKKELNKVLEKKSIQIQELKRYDVSLDENTLKDLRETIYDDRKFKNSLYKDYRFIFDFKNITVKRITSYKDEIFENKNKEFFGTLSKEEVTIFKFKDLTEYEIEKDGIENLYLFSDSIPNNKYSFHVSLEYNLIDELDMGTFLCSKN